MARSRHLSLRGVTFKYNARSIFLRACLQPPALQGQLSYQSVQHTPDRWPSEEWVAQVVSLRIAILMHTTCISCCQGDIVSRFLAERMSIFSILSSFNTLPHKLTWNFIAGPKGPQKGRGMNLV